MKLAWTTMKDFLEYRGQSDIYGSRDAIRKAYQLGLLDNGAVWMDMLQSRNKTSYACNEAKAREICTAVVEEYFSAFYQFVEKMDSIAVESER